MTVSSLSVVMTENLKIKSTSECKAFHPSAPGLILGVPKNFSLDVAEIY